MGKVSVQQWRSDATQKPPVLFLQLHLTATPGQKESWQHTVVALEGLGWKICQEVSEHA